MKTQSADTSPEAEAVQVALLRKASPARRLRMVLSLNRTVRSLALHGVRKRHPGLSAAEIRLLLAERLLGDSLAHQVYAGDTSGAVQNEDRWMDEDAIAALLPVIEQLDVLGIPYLLGGSLASSIHGMPRTTIDADLVAEIPASAVQTLVERLQPFYYLNPDALYEAIRHRRSFNLIHLASAFKIDVFVPKRRAFEQSQMARRRAEVLREDPERTALVATPEDTILAKLEWYRRGGEISDRQWNDLLGVLKVQGAALDLQYLRTWAANLGVHDLLVRALEDAGLA